MGSASLDLEALRDIFRDKRSHIVVGKVLDLELASDRSALFAKCSILTQDREVVAKVAWDAVGPNAGSFSFPQVGDLVLIEFAEGDPEQCFLTRRLSSNTDSIPTQAAAGDMVHKALAGKKLHLISDTKVLIGKGGAEPLEPLVLGNVLKEFLGKFLDDFLNAGSIGQCAVGPVFLDPAVRALMTAQKSQYISTAATDILSQIGYTERGT